MQADDHAEWQDTAAADQCYECDGGLQFEDGTWSGGIGDIGQFSWGGHFGGPIQDSRHYMGLSGPKPLIPAQRKVKFPYVDKLSDLPENMWTQVPNAPSGTQFYTQARIGNTTYPVMLDGGSSVNSITEDLVLEILNNEHSNKIPTNDKRHPIKGLEKWRFDESIRGVAASKSVQLLGAVIINLDFYDLVSEKYYQAPVRFKITASGATDWVQIIMGAAAIDCVELGGLGHRPGARRHHLDGLGIQVIRHDPESYTRPSNGVYTVQHPVCTMEHRCGGVAMAMTALVAMSSSCTHRCGGIVELDSCLDINDDCDDARIGLQVAGRPVLSASASSSKTSKLPELIYDNMEDIVLSPDDGVWLPVKYNGLKLNANRSYAVRPIQLDSDVEAASGLWHSSLALDQPSSNVCREGMIFVANCTELEQSITQGQPVATLKQCSLVTCLCNLCGSKETVIGDADMCRQCGLYEVSVPDSCAECTHPYDEKDKQSWQGCKCCASGGIVHNQGHVVEDTLGIAKASDIETPTDYYYDQLDKDMHKRHPKASESILEHCNSLEAFLDVSIIFGCSFGADKASIAVIEADLIGHRINRNGATCQEERTEAIVKFAPLKEVNHVRQFIGSTNWLRFYLPAVYPSMAKQLGGWMKEDAVFPPTGLGGGDGSHGDKLVRAIKVMAKHCIQVSSLDERAAIDGTRPLEQIADACGFEWGCTHLQMSSDLASMKILMMAGKGLSSAQQAWPTLELDGYAQLMGKRAQNKVLGPMWSIMWTDHSNFTKQQTIDSAQITVKMLR